MMLIQSRDMHAGATCVTFGQVLVAPRLSFGGSGDGGGASFPSTGPLNAVSVWDD